MLPGAAKWAFFERLQVNFRGSFADCFCANRRALIKSGAARAIILSRLTDWERPNWLNGEFSVRSRRVSLERPPPPLKVARQRRRRQKGHPVVATNRQQLHLVSRRWSHVGPSTAALCRCWMALYLVRGQRSAPCIMLSFLWWLRQRHIWILYGAGSTHRAPTVPRSFTNII